MTPTSAETTIATIIAARTVQKKLVCLFSRMVSSENAEMMSCKNQRPTASKIQAHHERLAELSIGLTLSDSSSCQRVDYSSYNSNSSVAEEFVVSLSVRRHRSVPNFR